MDNTPILSCHSSNVMCTNRTAVAGHFRSCLSLQQPVSRQSCHVRTSDTDNVVPLLGSKCSKKRQATALSNGKESFKFKLVSSFFLYQKRRSTIILNYDIVIV